MAARYQALELYSVEGTSCTIKIDDVLNKDLYPAILREGRGVFSLESVFSNMTPTSPGALHRSR